MGWLGLDRTLKIPLVLALEMRKTQLNTAMSNMLFLIMLRAGLDYFFCPQQFCDLYNYYTVIYLHI